MEGQPGLGDIQVSGELTNTPLSSPQSVQDLKPGLIGQGMTERFSATQMGVNAGSHTGNISRKVDR